MDEFVGEDERVRLMGENVVPITEDHRHRWVTQQVCKDCDLIQVMDPREGLPGEWDDVY